MLIIVIRRREFKQEQMHTSTVSTATGLYVFNTMLDIMVSVVFVAVMGGVIISMAVAFYAYIIYQPNVLEVNDGEPVVVGPIEYTVIFEGTNDGNEEFRPENTFVKVRIGMNNLDDMEHAVSGGQFYFVDSLGVRHWPSYGNGTLHQEDLLRDVLQPGNSISRTTQFDVHFDSDERYEVIVRPAKEHNSLDVGIVCITNC